MSVWEKVLSWCYLSSALKGCTQQNLVLWLPLNDETFKLFKMKVCGNTY